MAITNDHKATLAVQEIGTTIVKLKKLLEESVSLRVECAKLEFDMLTLYHTICPGELEGLRDEQESIEILEKTEDDGEAEIVE